MLKTLTGGAIVKSEVNNLGRWGYRKDMDCYRERLETTLAGQQDLSNLRLILMQFHRLAKLKLERAHEGYTIFACLSMAKIFYFW